MSRIFQNRTKRGTVIEISVFFMLITFALCVVIFSYVARYSGTAQDLRQLNEDKLQADILAEDFRRSPLDFDVESYQDYSMVYRPALGVLDVYDRSDLIDGIELFLSDPAYCMLYFSFAEIRGYAVRIVWEVNPSAPALEILRPTGDFCILKIYTQLAHGENGEVLPSKAEGYNLYEPVRLEWDEYEPQNETDEDGEILTDENGSPVQVTNLVRKTEDYSFDFMRLFYRGYARGVIYLTVRNGQFTHYEYGIN